MCPRVCFDFARLMADGHSSQGAPGSPFGGSHDSGGDQSPRSGVREQDRFLPIANISRIMKKGLPQNGKIAKDAKETVQECVSEFISFITSEYVGGFCFVLFCLVCFSACRVVCISVSVSDWISMVEGTDVTCINCIPGFISNCLGVGL